MFDFFALSLNYSWLISFQIAAIKAVVELTRTYQILLGNRSIEILRLSSQPGFIALLRRVIYLFANRS